MPGLKSLLVIDKKEQVVLHLSCLIREFCPEPDESSEKREARLVSKHKSPRIRPDAGGMKAFLSGNFFFSVFHGPRAEQLLGKSAGSPAGSGGSMDFCGVPGA